MKTPPDKIFLQWWDLDDYLNPVIADEVTWCEDKINNDDDIEYCKITQEELDDLMFFVVSDRFGNMWSAYCFICGSKTMEVVRPGLARCTECGS